MSRYGATAGFTHEGFYPRPPGADHYRYDLDASLRYTRFGKGRPTNPYPYVIGCISGFMPQQNLTVWSQMYGKEPSGPGPGSQPNPLNQAWQLIIPGLQKAS